MGGLFTLQGERRLKIQYTRGQKPDVFEPDPSEESQPVKMCSVTDHNRRWTYAYTDP